MQVSWPQKMLEWNHSTIAGFVVDLSNNYADKGAFHVLYCHGLEFNSVSQTRANSFKLRLLYTKLSQKLQVGFGCECINHSYVL